MNQPHGILVKRHIDPWFGMSWVENYSFIEFRDSDPEPIKTILLFYGKKNKRQNVSLFLKNEKGGLSTKKVLPISFSPNIFMDHIIHELRINIIPGLYLPVYAVYDIDERKVVHCGDSYWDAKKLCLRHWL